MAEGRRRRRRIRRILLRRQRPQRVVKDRLNPLEIYTDDELYDRFRFRRPTIHYLLGLLVDTIVHTNMNQALPPALQLLICLRFFCYWNFSQVNWRQRQRLRVYGWKMLPGGDRCHQLFTP